MSSRGPRADAVRNRARILAAAREAFAQAGVDVPLDAIAEAAGVGPGTVHRHFPTKAALLAAVIADRLDELAARAAELGDDPVEDFFGFLAELVDSGRDNLALAAAVGGLPNSLIEESGARLSAALQALLTAAQRAGGVRRDVDVAELHAVVTGVLATESRLSASRRGLGLQIVIDGLRTAPAE
ncbi:TetR/AcrR family transcriptional regulator [Tsukamurella soli]|uniref:TetR/AcrR family transcriptional regulator n=1 Tax=Tsukamurella soli TaxID=644556 RepID=A0ABP8JQ90_9ACTN